MIFSFGNLLSIVVVLVILIIYRQIDRNNRSLDKVKRFSDKMKGELASSVDEKTAEMKNLAIELQVNMKAGKEVLKRVREVEDGLNDRAQGIDEIRNRINSYDHALEELVSMTTRVDENLKRIQSESLFVDKVGKRITGASQKLRGVEQEISRLQQKFKLENQKGLEAVRADITRSTAQRMEKIAGTVAESEKKVKDFGVYVSRLEARTEQMQNEVVDSVKKSFAQLELDARAKRTGFLNQYVASLNKLLAEADAKGKVLKKGYSETLSAFEMKLGQAAKRGEALEAKVFDNLKALIAKDSENLTAQRKELKKKVEEVVAFRQQIGTQMNTLQRESERLKAESLKSISEAAEQMQVSALQSIEDQLEGYSKEIEYKFQKLETANLDIEAMDKNLHELISKTSAKAREEFGRFTTEFAAERKSEREEVQSEFDGLRTGMRELEQGLTDLKSKAYENVSEQLQVFEDDFFKDLRERNSSMEERLQAWQSEIEAKMQEVAAAEVSERQNLKKRFSEELKNELERIKQESHQGFRKIEAEVSQFENSVSERINGSEQTIEGLKTGLESQLEQIRSDAQGILEKKVKGLQDSVEENVQHISREVEERLRAMEGSVVQNKSELEQTVDSAKGEIAAWQARVAQALKTYELEFSEKYGNLRQDSENEIAKIRDDFAGQSEDLISSTNTERLQLKEQFKVIAERTEALEKRLLKSSESALENFKRQVEAFQVQINERSKDLQEETDNRVRDLKQRMVDMKDKLENQSQSLFGKIEESYKLLSINLNDMDKRVKGFVGQTKIFERADELKTQLEGWIGDMKRDMEKLQSQHKEIEGLESKVLDMRKTVEDIGTKLGKLLSERSRVEDMDSDFKKLLHISKDLDHRIDTVYSSQDALQEIQAKIRELENLEKITEGRFDRLEKKKAIVEATTLGVDKNFEQLDLLDKELKAVGKNLKGFSGQLKELKAQAEQLSSGREKSEYVIEKLENLDSILGDLEQRMEKLEKAREWLAKTETRFENIGKQAQEQVRLMESILKADKKQSKLGEGAPPLDKRETVVKLAHLGWTPVEIARTTKLSRGEVELILELAPKK